MTGSLGMYEGEVAAGSCPAGTGAAIVRVGVPHPVTTREQRAKDCRWEWAGEWQPSQDPGFRADL